MKTATSHSSAGIDRRLVATVCILFAFVLVALAARQNPLVPPEKPDGRVKELPAGVSASPCVLPGVSVLTDPTGDEVDPFSPLPDPPGYSPTTQDIQGVFFAELASTPD